MADSVPITMSIVAGGSGPGPNGVGDVSETITGTFEFDPTTASMSEIVLFGSGIVSEYWDFGPVFGTPLTLLGYDSFGWSGNVGSQGDVLNFAAIVSPNGGFVPAGGGEPLLSGSAVTSNLRLLDSWGGTITPAPEPTSFVLYGMGLAAFLILALLKRASHGNSKLNINASII